MTLNLIAWSEYGYGDGDAKSLDEFDRYESLLCGLVNDIMEMQTVDCWTTH